MPIAAGTRLGPYEVVSPLGAGGMGEVYRARDPRLDRDVAIKVLPRDVDSDTERLRRFETEAKAASALNHPVLLTVLDIGRHQDAPYVVFELLEGQTLRERLDRGAFPVRRAIDLAVQMAGGLAAAHDKGIVHRDLKPENLFLTRDGRVKILDFGLAKLRPGVAGGGDGTTDSAITGRGVVMGTVGYMSPEQVLGQAVDQRSDIFSLGVVLYEMLTGRRPFHRAASVETMSAILKEDPPELTDSVLGIPGGVARTVKRCLEKSPTDRFRSAHDLAFALEALSGPTPLPPRARRGRWLGPAAVATAALVLPVVGYVVGRAGRAPLVPTFQRLTHGRGTVVSARFTPDGRTVVYGAAWDGSPIRLYSTRTESPESAPLKLADANLFSVSPSGELAVSVGLPSVLMLFSTSTLATVPLAGEALNERLHDVSGADWSPDGQLAAVRRVAGRYRLEYPLGRVLYEAPPPSFLVGVRVSPDGRHVAVGRSTWAENMGPPQGVMVLDREGRSTVFSEGPVNVVSLAWTPRGDEIWLSTGVGRVEAMDLQGRRRVVTRLPADVQLTDISKEGRVLLLIGDTERRMAVLRPGDAKEQEVSLFGFSQVTGLSADGRTLLFSTLTRNAWFAYVRSTDASSAAVKLGPGFAQALSPDGAWAIVEDPATVLSLVPTGPGDRRRLNTTGLMCAEAIQFLPDARRALATCIADGRPPAAYVLDVDGRAPQRLTPEGTTCNAVSSREAACAASDADSPWLAYPFSGGPPRPIPGIAPREQDVVQWSADGRSVFVREFRKLPQPVHLLDVETGRQRPWKTIVPREPAGTQYLSLLVTPDGRSYAYSYQRRRSDLWLVDGLVR